MKIYGSSITEFEYRINPGFQVNTSYDMEWFQVNNGNWYSVDRGANADVYECKIATFGNETYINNIITQLESNRSADSIIYMSGFSSNEYIFGEDVNHHIPLSGVVLEYGVREQNSFKGFKFDLELRVLSPTFSGVSSLPSWSDACLLFSPGYEGDSSWTVNKYDTYYSDFHYYDHENDAGLFKGTFNFTNSDLRSLRRWIATNRDTSFSLTSIGGVTYPFGPREGTGPWDVKIIDIDEKEPFGLDRRLVKLTIARHY